MWKRIEIKKILLPNNASYKLSRSLSTRRDLIRLLDLYRDEKPALTVSLTALSISTAITMCIPVGMGTVIDMITTPSGLENLTAFTGSLASLFILGAGANVLRVHTANLIGERITMRLRTRTFAKMMDQEMAFFDSSKTGELVHRLSSDATLVGTTLSDSAASGFRSVAQSVGSVSMMVYTCPQLAMLMCTVVPPVAIGAMMYGSAVKKLTTKVQDRLGAANEVAEERIGNIRTVRWFTNEEKEKNIYNKHMQNVLKLADERSRSSAKFFGAVDLSVKMSMLATMGYGGQVNDIKIQKFKIFKMCY